jgi:non-ribosomal peptide synthase protein (TIGR01720 family)
MNPKQIEEFFHLSPVQKHLLSQSEQAAEANAYLGQLGCYLTGNLDVSAFERAWQTVTNRQPGLRITFVSGDLKDPVQVVNRNVGVELEKQDWRNLAVADQERRLHELLHVDRQCGFVLKTAPLWRMTLIRLSEERYYFIWTYHELLFDERSLPLLFNEALASYAALQQGKSEILPPPISFRKYVDWVKEQNLHEAERFWRSYLNGLFSPTLVELTAEQTSARLELVTLDRLKLLAADANLSLEVIVKGAWALLLSRLSGLAEVLFGATVAGRPPQLSTATRIVGHFSNTLPLRIRVPFELTVQDYLASIQAQRSEWLQYAHNSLAQIHHWSEFPAEQPLFQSTLIFDAAELETALRTNIAGIEISPERLVLPNEFPLPVMVKEDANGWQLTSHDARASQLRFILEQFAHDPQQQLAAIQLPASAPTDSRSASPLPPDLPEEWGGTTEDEQGWITWLKAGSCVHELFEEQVARTPDAVAVQLNDHALTFRELNASANQLARYLHKLQVLPSIPVGLCFVPALEAVIGMLGILKAGGAYLPLNPALSPDALSRILAESAVAIVLTQSHLEPKFRPLPVSHLVLCLDSDWRIIGEEDAENPGFQVSDEHPACVLSTAETPTLVTHAHLAQAVTSLSAGQAWFRFEADNPWHLFCATSSSLAAELQSESALLDLTPEPAWETTLLPELELDPVLELATEPDGELSLDLAADALLQPQPESEKPASPPSTIPAPKLAPIQQWFFGQSLPEPQQWNISLLVEISDPLDRSLLELALQTVVAQHEALRWHFTETATGWQVGEALIAGELPFDYVDFSAKWARSQRKAIEETADQLQASLNLSTGPLWRVAYFDLGANRPHRLLVIFHHLIGDQVALRIFLEDLLGTYGQIRRNQLPTLRPEHTTYLQWLQAAMTASQDTDLDYWQKQQAAAFGVLPLDHPDGANTYEQMDRVFVSLNSAETDSLLQQVPLAAGAEINEIVLTALALALAQWTDASQVLIEVERNARQDALPGVDVTRTIGWFAVKFPLRLAIEPGTEEPAALRAVQAQLCAVPDQGRSYGWLRYGRNEAARAALRDLPPPQISFSYLDLAAAKLDWHLASETVGNEQHPHNQRSTAIAVTGAMNLNMLEFQWSYARAQFEQRTIGLLVHGFIAELRRLIQYYDSLRAQSDK